MKKRLEALKRDRSSGFTLVELIVVLIILAILAALLIPALTGYIDKAKERTIIAETRSCVMAAQTLADEDYAGVNVSTTLNGFTKKNIKALADVPGDVQYAVYSTTGDTKGKITQLEYKDGDDYCLYKYVDSKGTYEIKSSTTSAPTENVESAGDGT